MKKLLLVQAILLLIICQYSSAAFTFDGTMGSLALQIYSTLTHKQADQSDIQNQDSMTKLVQQVKLAAQNRQSQNGTIRTQTPPLLGARPPTSNQSVVKTTPEDKMSKLARSLMNAFAPQNQQNNNKTQNTNQTVVSNNSSSPVKPVIIVPEVNPNTTNTTNSTQPTKNTTVVIVVVESNKTNETIQTNQSSPAPQVNQTIETNQTSQTSQVNQTTQTNQTTNQTKPNLPPVQSTHTIGIEKTEIPVMKVEDECFDQIQHSLAIIYNLGIHATAQNVEKVRRDYDALKTITLSINKVCSKSFSINIKPNPFFNNTGVCESELSELTKLATNFNQNAKDIIIFAKTIQNFWYRHQNFLSSCIITPVEEPKIENTTKPTQQSEAHIREQREINCLLAFAEAIGAVNKMSGNIASWNPSATQTMIKNLHTRISSINNYCDAKFTINVESVQAHAAQGDCQKDYSLLKMAVEKFTSEDSKELNRISQAIRQISYIGTQVLSDC